MRNVLAAIKAARQARISVLLVEQNVRVATEIADRAYVLDDSRVTIMARLQSLRKTKIAYAPLPALA